MYKTVLVLVAASIVCLRSSADDSSLRQTAAKLLEKHGDSLATVKLTVVHRTMIEKKEVQKAEHAIEIPGTVISDEGMVVISASAVDFLPDLSVPAPLNMDEISMEFERKDARIRFVDGREMAAEFLGRGVAHDLAFLIPKDKTQKRHFIALESQQPLNVADGAIVLYPLTRLLHRHSAVAIRSVAAVAPLNEKKLPVLDSNELRILGCPVFSSAGHPVGIATTLRPPQEPHAFLSNFENMEPDIVVMDAAAVKKALLELKDKPKSGK